MNWSRAFKWVSQNWSLVAIFPVLAHWASQQLIWETLLVMCLCVHLAFFAAITHIHCLSAGDSPMSAVSCSALAIIGLWQMPSITIHYCSHENTTLTHICLCRLYPREITRDSLRNKLHWLTQKLANSCHRLQISAPKALRNLFPFPFILPAVFFTSWSFWPPVQFLAAHVFFSEVIDLTCTSTRLLWTSNCS